MFSFLKKKFNLYMIIATVLVITVPFISLYAFFYHSLEQDYIENSYNSQRQITRLLDTKLTQIQNSIDMYIFRTKLGSTLPRENTVNVNFTTLKTYAPEVDYSIIYGADMSLRYYNSYSAVNIFNNILDTGELQQRLAGKEKFWQCTYYTNSANNKTLIWIYTAPIYSNDVHTGYISVMIPNRFFLNFFEDYKNEYGSYNSFYLYSDTASSYCINEMLLSEHKLTADDIYSALDGKPAQKKYKHMTVSAYPLSVKEMHLICILRTKYPASLSHILLSWIVIAWIVLVTLCIFSATKITSCFIGDLQNFKSKINDYTDQKEKEQKNDQDNDC